MRPVLQSLGIEHFAIQELDQVEFVVSGMVKQAFATQSAGRDDPVSAPDQARRVRGGNTQCRTSNPTSIATPPS